MHNESLLSQIVLCLILACAAYAEGFGASSDAVWFVPDQATQAVQAAAVYGY